MIFRSWLKKIRRGSSRKARRVVPRRPIMVERLEDRITPSLSSASWTAVGPAPITGGQTNGGFNVSGRITGVAADPTDPLTLYAAAAGGGVWKTTNGGGAWTALTDSLTDSGGKPIPLFMGAIAETRGTGGNQIVYAGTGESNNSGDSFYGVGILVSTDGGATWTLRNAGGAFTGRTVSKIAVDPHDATGNTVYAAVSDFAANGTSGNTGIWKSTDGGVNWTNTTGVAPNNLSTSDEWSDVVIDPTGATTTLYAAEGTFFGAAGNGVYKSTDAGGTWTLLSNGPTGVNAGRIALALFDNGATNELLVSVAGDSGGGTNFGELRQLLKSTNGGSTFTDLTANVPNYMGSNGFGQGWYDTTLAVDPANSNFIYAGGSDNGGSPGNVESFDGGNTWQQIVTDPASAGPHSDDHAVTFDANGALIDGDDGGLFRLDNPTNANTQRWSSLNNSGLQITQFTGVALDLTTPGTTAYGGSQDNGTEKTTQAQTAAGWSLIVGGDGGIVRVDPTNPAVIYHEFTGVSIQVSTNSGATFSTITNGIKGGGNFYAPYVLDSAGNVYFGSTFLNFSANQGGTWSQIGTPGTSGFNTSNAAIDAVAVSPTNNNVVYVSAGGKMFVTQNAQAGGANVTWTEIDLPSGLGARARNSIAVDPSAAGGGTAYAVVSAFGASRVFKTTNFGANWNDATGNLPNTPVDSVAVGPNGATLWVGTDVGVYSTTNGGASWAAFQSGFPNAQVVELEFDSAHQILAAGTHGRGMWEISTAAAATVADLVVSVSGPSTVTAGTDVTYTITLVNNGPSDAQAVSLSDMVPAGTTFVSATPVAGSNPDGFSYTQSAGTVTGTPTGGVVHNGNTDQFFLVVHANSSDANGSTISDTATVTTTTTDDSSANDETATVTSNVAAVADLVVSASGPASVTAGTNLTYTITLVNNGPSDAQAVSLSDMVPAGTTFVSATPVAGSNPDGFSYSQSAGTVTGTPTGGVVHNGNTDQFILVVHANSSDANGSTISDTATVTTTTTDDSSANDETATVNSTVNAVADLVVSVSGPSTITAGTDVTYTITLVNNGPSDAQAVSLSDLVPAGTTFVSATPVGGSNPDGFSYSQSAGTVTGTPTGGVVHNGDTDQFILVVHANSSDANGSTISNTATVTTTTTDDSAANDETATVNSTVNAVADLVISASGPSTVTAGTDATYTITLVNNGPSDAQAVSLSDMVPAGTTFVSATPVAGSNPDGFSYTQSAGTVTGTPTGGVVHNGNTDQFTLVVHALSSDANGSTISNTATVTTTTTDDSNTDNDETATVNSNVAAVADLGVSVSGPTSVTAGTDVTYTITLVNNGPSDAQGVSLSDMVPVGTTFVSATPVGGSNPDGFSYTQSAGTVTGTPTGGVVRNGNTDQFTLVIHALSSDANGSTISDTATVTTTTTDDSSANDETATANSTVNAVADLVVSMSGPSTVTAGTDATYTITLVNNGPSDAQAVSLTDLVPAGTTFVSATPVAGSNPDGFSYTQSAGTVTGTPTGGVVAAGHTDQFTLVVHAASSDANGSTISNTATVTTTTTDDSTANDETATVNSTVNAVADLVVTVNGPTSVVAGTNAVYTITLTNNGPSDAQGVSLSDMVPAGTTFVSATPVGGSNPDGFTYTQSAGTVTGTPTGGVTAAGHIDQFTLVVHALSSDPAGAQISDAATVTTTTTDDSNTDIDETASFTSNVTAVADLGVSQTNSPNATEGQTLTLTITVANNGPSDAPSVMLTDALPAGATFVSSSFAGYSAATNTVNLGTIAAGGSVMGTITVATPEEGSVVNSATVTTTASDDNDAFNDETNTATIAVADPQIAVLPSGVAPFQAVEGADSAVQTVALFRDPGGPGDTDYTATISWGDGTAADTATLANGGLVDIGTANGAETFAVRGHHSYVSSGTLSITVSIQHAALAPVAFIDPANVSGDVVINGTNGDDVLTVFRTPGGGVGSIIYILNGGPAVALGNVHSFTFNGLGGNDVMNVSAADGEPLVPAGVFFDGGAGANTLTLDAAGRPVRTVPGGLTVGDPQTVLYANTQTINVNNAAAVDSFGGPDTADRTAAFLGLTPQERFVQALYLDELGRAGVRSELDGWLARFNLSEFGRSAIASSIQHSGEAREHLVLSWYAAYLGRSAVGGEEQGWVNQLLQGQSEETVLSGILGSGEFYSRAQTLIGAGTADQRYVQALYQLLLNRSGAPAETASWIAVLPPLGRSGVALAFLQSPEFRTDLFEGCYNALLHRPDDPAALSAWVFSNLDTAAGRVAFEASSEFFAGG